MGKENTIVIPLIRTDLIRRCLETLYRYTPNNFYVYIFDQSIDGIEKDIIDKYCHLYIRPYRNLGFAKSFNEGLKLCETKYYTTCNDDIEFIGDWYDGVLKTFDKVDKATPERPCAMVTPSSIKLPDWSVGRESGDDFYIMPYKEFYTEEDYNFLLNEDHYINKHLTIKPDTVIDGVTMYASVFKKELLDKIGWLDEKFYPGSGEDYSWGCRANMRGYRSVGTTLSWVYHHWSSSLAKQEDYKKIIDDKIRWNSTTEIWGDNFDLWGNKCPKCSESMRIIKGTNYATCSKRHIKYKMPKVLKVNL